MYRGVAQFGRALGSGPRGLEFKSPHSDQIGTSVTRSDFLFHKKSVTRFTVPPLRKKSRCAYAVRLQARSQRLTVATNFLRFLCTFRKLQHQCPLSMHSHVCSLRSFRSSFQKCGFWRFFRRIRTCSKHQAFFRDWA